MKKFILLLAVLLYAKNDSLVTDMCNGIDYYNIDECPMQLIQKAITKGVIKIEKNQEGKPISFTKADAFNNKDKVYPIFLKFNARLGEKSGLFIDEKNRLVYIENLPNNVRFYPEGKYIGFIKGEGAYKLTFPFTDNSYEMIPKGKVITIKRETNTHWK